MTFPAQDRARSAIDTAVLLAAGRGRRLGALTARMPKPLLEVAGAPLLAHIISGLADAGVKEFVIVVGYLATSVEAFARKFARSHSCLKLTTVRQPKLNGTGGAMETARGLVGAKRFLFGWGDILMDPRNYPRFAARARQPDYDLLLAVNQVQEVSAGAAVYLDRAMRVKRLVEKPPPGTSSTHWNNAGLFAADPRLFDYLAGLTPTVRGEVELPQAIAQMAADGLDVRAIKVRGFWSDVGTPKDLARARALYRRAGAR